MTIMEEKTIDSSDVATLVRRAAEGDRKAWECLVSQYERLIWSITVEFKLVESDAADVAQTTWLRLLEHIHRIEYPDRVGSWLAATARNECLRSLAAMTPSLIAPRHPGLRLMSASSPTNVIRSSATLCPACPGDGRGGSGCSWP